MQEPGKLELVKELGWLFRASRVLKFLLWALLILLGIASGIGLTTLAQLGSGKTELAKLRSELAATKERVSRLEKSAYA